MDVSPTALKSQTLLPHIFVYGGRARVMSSFGARVAPLGPGYLCTQDSGAFVDISSWSIVPQDQLLYGRNVMSVPCRFL